MHFIIQLISVCCCQKCVLYLWCAFDTDDIPSVTWIQELKICRYARIVANTHYSFPQISTKTIVSPPTKQNSRIGKSGQLWCKYRWVISVQGFLVKTIQTGRRTIAATVGTVFAYFMMIQMNVSEISAWHDHIRFFINVYAICGGLTNF